MDMKTALGRLADKDDLSFADMRELMQTIMSGQATQAQIGAFLMGLRLKGETVAEISAAAEVMRSLAASVEVSGEYLVDTCGTGGDGANIFNVSTACAFVAAAAGAQVAKHGNRSVSSKSGSADLLEKAGVNLDLTPEQVARCVAEVGVGFMFAPKHHAAMKHAIGPRKELGLRTLFNLLGPLTNPARVPNQVLGVFSADWVRPLAEVLKQLGSRHVMVVHAEDGLDEISIAAPTQVAELKQGEITEYRIEPEMFGLTRQSLDSLMVDSVEASLQVVTNLLENQAGPALDMVCLNAGAAIYVSGAADSLANGVRMAEDALGSGLAREKLNDLVSFSRCFAV